MAVGNVIQVSAEAYPFKEFIMAVWPANGEVDWNTKMLANLAIGHATDGTHNQAGLTAQVVGTVDVALIACDVAMPLDDTIPQKTEGTEVMTQAITPKKATNFLRIDVVAHVSADNDINVVLAVFRDDTANAVSAVSQNSGGTDGSMTISMTAFFQPASTTLTTFKVRIGTSDGSGADFNGNNGSRLFAGVSSSSLLITEVWT